MHKGKIIVFGIMFWYPLAGVTYQFLHYLIGLKRLGYDVYYVEDSGRWIYDPDLNDLSPDASGNIASVEPILAANGFGGKWAFRGHYPDGQCYGMSESQILRLYQEADAFLNVTGAQEIREEHLSVPRRIYVETDPFAGQVELTQGSVDMNTMLDAHDTLFSFGENVNNPDFAVPVKDRFWHPTRQPVVIEFWQRPSASGPTSYTTITTWKNKGKDVTYNGEVYYWTKDREFEKFIDLPQRRSGASFELATRVDDDIKFRLESRGWKIAESIRVSRDVGAYRGYIQSSRGEFTVAKDQVTRSNSGWFSDRSACYLAAGRPVITQETAFSKFLPSGKGLYGFQNMEDILAAVDDIEANYTENCKAASDIAHEYFAAEKVLKSLIDRAGL